MNQSEATSKLYDCLCRSCAPKAEEILTAAIEQALAVQPKQEPVALAEQYARSHAKFLFKAPHPLREKNT